MIRRTFPQCLMFLESTRADTVSDMKAPDKLDFGPLRSGSAAPEQADHPAHGPRRDQRLGEEAA